MASAPPPAFDGQIILGTGQRIDVATTEREVIRLPTWNLMHTICSGKSGYGKSRWLCSLAVMLLSRGVSFTLIDPAGDLARLVLQQLISLGYFDNHPDPFSRLLYLDLPAALRKGLFLPFNVLKTGHDPYTTADMVLEAFKRAWPALKSGTATNIETLVKLGSFVLASHQLPLFPHLYYLLTDPAYRHALLRDVCDDLVVQFFKQQTNNRTGELALGTDATLKRLLLLSFAPILRYSLGQPGNVLNFRTLLAEGKSLVINLNLPDPEALRLLGCLITVNAEMGAKSRGEIRAEQRFGWHVLMIDEFQNFCSQSAEAMGHILDECRKMGLFLCLAHQSFAQIPSSLRGALNNCEIRVVFRLERSDAEESMKLLSFPIDPTLTKPSVSSHPRYYSSTEQKELHVQAITQLAKREAFVKLPGDRLYRMRSLTVADPPIDPEKLATVEQEYLRRYFRSQAEVEHTMAATLSRTQAHHTLATVQQREHL